LLARGVLPRKVGHLVEKKTKKKGKYKNKEKRKKNSIEKERMFEFCSSFPLSVSHACFPNIRGTYFGRSDASYPSNHPKYPNQAVAGEQVLTITKQQDNLLWGENKWRLLPKDMPPGPWITERFTGTFNTPRQFWLVEEGPTPVGGTTGLWQGRVLDADQIEVTYLGLGGGISLLATLKRKSAASC
jgi:hypothetical protein